MVLVLGVVLNLSAGQNTGRFQRGILVATFEIVRERNLLL